VYFKYLYIYILGPTLAGKSTFILKLIRHRAETINVTFENIYYCCPKEEVGTHREYLGQLSEACPSLQLIKGVLCTFSTLKAHLLPIFYFRTANAKGYPS
jgi:hypothetical protein